MNENILKQLRFKTKDEGFLGLSKDSIIGYDEVISRIVINAESVLESVIDTDYPHLSIEIPSSILIRGEEYPLSMQNFKESGEACFVNLSKKASFDFSYLLTDPSSAYFDARLLYESRPDFVEVGVHSEGHAIIYFIDNVTGDVGHFPTSVTFAISKSDKERFLKFDTEKARDNFFASVFNLPDESEEELDSPYFGSATCDCPACNPQKKTGGLDEVINSIMKIAYLAPNKTIQESSPIPFTKEQLDCINTAVENTAHLSIAARPQAIRNLLTNQKL